MQVLCRVLVGAAALTLLTQKIASLPPYEVLRARTLEEYMAAQEASKMKSLTRHLRRTSEMEHSEPIVAECFGDEPGFYHRVAPGYPLFDRVILWTRYTPVASGESVYLELRMAEVVPDIPYESHLDPDANDKTKIAKIETSASSDYVAKIGVFTFTDVIVAAEVGQTRTA